MEILDCMRWSSNLFSMTDLDLAESQEEAAFLLAKFRTQIVWNVLKNFEGTPITLPQTEIILEGLGIEGVAIRDLLKVKFYGEALDGLFTMLKDNSFDFDMHTLCLLHSVVGKEEVPLRGAFRTRDVRLKGIEGYLPPLSVTLNDRWGVGSTIVESITNPLEKAAVAFLFLARTQFFEDANKRTAFLMMNGLLVKNSINPFVFPQSDRLGFMECLTAFYESGDADDMLQLIRSYALGEKL